MEALKATSDKHDATHGKHGKGQQRMASSMGDHIRSPERLDYVETRLGNNSVQHTIHTSAKQLDASQKSASPRRVVSMSQNGNIPHAYAGFPVCSLSLQGIASPGSQYLNDSHEDAIISSEQGNDRPGMHAAATWVSATAADQADIKVDCARLEFKSMVGPS